MPSTQAPILRAFNSALLVTGDPVTGPVSLRKPATFAETGWLLCWSVAPFVGYLPLLVLAGVAGLFVAVWATSALPLLG